MRFMGRQNRNQQAHIIQFTGSSPAYEASTGKKRQAAMLARSCLPSNALTIAGLTL
jgi:hypothetical protein